MTPLSGALEMAGLGFSVFPLKAGTKDGHLSKSWKAAATTDRAQIEALAKKHPGCNWGMRCAGHLVLDVDVADGQRGEESFLALEIQHEIPVTRIHKSARGGEHVLFKMPTGVEVSNRDAPLGPGINVRGAGGYIVCPGSTFQGRPYSVHTAAAVAPAPATLVALLKAAPAVKGAPIPEAYQDNPADVARAVSFLCSRPQAVHPGRGYAIYEAACWLRDWNVSHGTALELIAEHFGELMDPPADAAFCAHETASAYKNAQNTVGSKSVFAQFDDMSDFAAQFAPPADAAPVSKGAQLVWPVMKLDPKTKEPTDVVAAKAIKNIKAHLDFTGTTVWLDAFSSTLQVRSAYFASQNEHAPFDGELLDGAFERLRLDAQERGLHAPKDHYYDVVGDIAFQKAVHPVKTYLDGLVWDGVGRASQLFTRYAGAADTPLNRAAATLILVAAVRRIRQPGCKFDFLPVLEGTQGKGKSTLIRIMAGPWSGVGLSLDLDEQKLLERTSSKWIVEIDELAGLNTPKGLAHVKSLITREEGRSRASYARFAKTTLRNWIAIATTNESTYLTDPTGNRRFLPIKVNGTDFDAIKADRDALWAEAVVLERSYGPLILPKEVHEELERAQSDREIVTPYRETLEPIYGGTTPGYVPCSFVRDLVSGERGKILTPQEGARLAETMTRLGFKKARHNVSGGQQYVWVRYAVPGVLPEMLTSNGAAPGLRLVVDNDAEHAAADAKAAAERAACEMLE